jgi:hypothetical protein
MAINPLLFGSLKFTLDKDEHKLKVISFTAHNDGFDEAIFSFNARVPYGSNVITIKRVCPTMHWTTSADAFSQAPSEAKRQILALLSSLQNGFFTELDTHNPNSGEGKHLKEQMISALEKLDTPNGPSELNEKGNPQLTRLRTQKPDTSTGLCVTGQIVLPKSPTNH